jgi:ketosteroid isomerase-like protein
MDSARSAIPACSMSAHDEAAHFVATFQTFWSAPSADKLSTICSPEVVLVHPLGKPLHGMSEARAWMDDLLRSVPDLRAVVERWSASGDSIFIEFRMQGSVAGQSVSWRAVDRITLEAGLARERISYFDAWPLLSAQLRRPSVWWLLWQRARQR